MCLAFVFPFLVAPAFASNTPPFSLRYEKSDFAMRFSKEKGTAKTAILLHTYKIINLHIFHKASALVHIKRLLIINFYI